MKILQFFIHPVVVIVSFLFILVSGDHTGGFYLMYVLMGLPHFTSASLLATAAVIFILAGAYSVRRNVILRCCLNFIGAAMSCLSLLSFFARDVKGYNDGTFEHVVPLISLAFFSFIVITFVLTNVVRCFKNRSHKFNKPEIH